MDISGDLQGVLVSVSSFRQASFVGKTMSGITHLGMVYSTYKNAALGDSDWFTMFYPHDLHLNTLSLSM